MLIREKKTIFTWNYMTILNMDKLQKQQDDCQSVS